MEKRLGVIALILEDRDSAQQFNRILSEFHDLVLARQGVPLRDRYEDGRDLHVISLVVEGTTDQLGALTGRLGKLNGVQVKSVLSKAQLAPNPQEAPLAHRELGTNSDLP
jgi:putative iron-only hydrogenase system regulator